MERIGLAPGTEIGGYTVVAPLGSGGMGTVYRAVDGGGTPVALKLLHPQVGSDAAARARLTREVAALQKLKHPGVAAVLDAEADSTEAFLVTELVDGIDLDEQVREHGPLTAGELLDLAAGLRDALVAVHAAGVVHRDLKPSNVLVTAAGPVLIDFGIAQGVEDTRVTSVGLVVGTPGYLAPEQLDGAEPGPAADWWGWAAVLAFAATGRPPFGSGPMATVLARSRAGTADLAGLGPLTAGGLTRALAADPDERLAADDLVAALTVVAAEGELEDDADEEPAADEGTDAAAGDDATDQAAVDAGSEGDGSAADDADDHGTGPDGQPDDERDAAGTAVLTGADAAGTAVLTGADAAGTTALAAGTAVAVRPAAATTALAVGPHDGRTRAMPAGSPKAAAATAKGSAVAATGGGPDSGVVPIGDDLDQDDEDFDDDDGDDEIAYGPEDGVEWIEDDLDHSAGDGGTGSGYRRPRPVRRIVSLLALAAVVFVAGALWPAKTLVVVGALVLLTRAAGSDVEAMYARREKRGVRGSDRLVAVLAAPWYLLRALVALVPSVLMAASVAVITVGVAWWFVGQGRWTIGENRPGDLLAGTTASWLVGLLVLLAVALVWFGPLSAMTRIGARRVLEAVSPLRLGALVVVLLALAVATILALRVLHGAGIDYAPLPTPTLPPLPLP